MPWANDDIVENIDEGETVSIDILSNDIKTSSPLDSTSVSLVAPVNAIDVITDNEGDIIGFIIIDEGEWSVDEDSGKVTFVPDQDIMVNPTPIKYTVKEENGDESNIAIIEIKYNISNISSIFATDNLDVVVTDYNPIVIDVLGNGDSFGSYGAGNVEITFTQPEYGTLALDDGGTPNDPTDDVLIYTPVADMNGIIDNATYTITDAQGNTSAANILINVECASSQTSDGGDALDIFGIIMMIFLIILSGLYMIREESEVER
jgi:CshA-type fibril repeat protein